MSQLYFDMMKWSNNSLLSKRSTAQKYFILLHSSAKTKESQIQSWNWTTSQDIGLFRDGQLSDWMFSPHYQ